MDVKQSVIFSNDYINKTPAQALTPSESARQEIILHPVWFLLDPVFRGLISIVEISICGCLYVTFLGHCATFGEDV